MADRQATCRECGAQFSFPPTRGQVRKYCSEACRVSLGRRAATARIQQDAAARRCEGCGTSGTKKSKGLCQPCSTEQKSIRKREARRLICGRLSLPPQLVSEHGPRQCVCAECGEGFRYIPCPGHLNGHLRSYCSGRCRKRSSDRIKTQRRRAAIRGAAVERVDYNAVFARDGWVCQICRRKTDRKARGLMKPRSPVVDHITPLSKGGAHAYINLQTACHACNSKKGAGAGGQMLLFDMVG